MHLVLYVYLSTPSAQPHYILLRQHHLGAWPHGLDRKQLVDDPIQVAHGSDDPPQRLPGRTRLLVRPSLVQQMPWAQVRRKRSAFARSANPITVTASALEKLQIYFHWAGPGHEAEPCAHKDFKRLAGLANRRDV
jgi:hypothetical protein